MIQVAAEAPNTMTSSAISNKYVSSPCKAPHRFGANASVPLRWSALQSCQSLQHRTRHPSGTAGCSTLQRNQTMQQGMEVRLSPNP